MKINFIYAQLILFLFTNSVFTQNKLNITIKNGLNQLLETVNIQVINSKSNKIVAFGVTDENGIYLTELTDNGFYKIKATYIGYEPAYKEFELISNQTVEIIIKENNNYLKEVVVKANSSGLIQKGDTLTYSVEKFMNGTEETLKDIIKKLPGLDINSNGQITTNGKEIDKILVDGEDFFKNQHKLATENLSSQMIKNVELIKNYKEFKSLDNNANTNTTAININIKDEFKNKITGNIQTGIGFSEKYKLHTNLFSFRKKTKTTLISGFNNTGEQDFTMYDYYSLIEENKTYDLTSSSIEIPNQDDVPKFLLSSNNAKSRKTEFVAFNSVYTPTKKLKLYIYSIFHNSKQIQEQALKQDYIFSDVPFSNTEINSISEKSLFNSTNIETTFKHNNRNIINLTTSFNLIKTVTNNNIENISTAEQNLFYDKGNINHYTINNKLEYSRSFENKNLLSVSINQTLDKNYNQKFISSNNPFLGLTFSNTLFDINQNKEINKSIFGYDAKYSIKLEKNQLNIFSGSSYENSNLNNSVENQNQFENHLILKTNDNFIGIEFNCFLNNIFSYNIGITNHYVTKKTNPNINYNFNFLSPRAKIKAQFSPNNILELNYSYSNKFPPIDNVLQSKIIQDYRNIYQNEDVYFNTIIPYHQASISYFYFKQPAFTLITNLNYSLNEKFINVNSQNNILSNLNQFKVLPNEKTISAMYYVEKYFSKKKLSIKHNFVYSSIKKPINFNGIVNQFEINNYTIDGKLVSSYKSFPINFEAGFILSKNIYSNSQNKSNFESKEIFQTITGKFTKDIFWSLNSNNIFQKSELRNQNVFMLNPKIRFSKSKFDFSIYGYNILNIKNTESIEVTNTNNYIEQRTNQILSGYIMFELKYKM